MNLDLFSKNCFHEVCALHKELCVIPAPSHYEDKRAEYILNYLKNAGIDNVYIDEAKNVICILGEQSKNITLFEAHTDTVFPIETPLNYIEDGNIIKCPGAGDDTGCLAVMLCCVKYMAQNNIVPKKKIMFVANSCEEGLGNLKGTRKIFKDYGNRIDRMYSFDSSFKKIVNKSVGSHRYEVTAITEGGHSFGMFGNRNAISVLAKIINDIYSIQVPQIGNSKTTYNVGTICGGTSVNTIAQSASMLCEYRSDNIDCLSEMKSKFEKIFKEAEQLCIELKVELVGDRPCMSNSMDMYALDEITQKAVIIQSKHTECDVELEAGSTDCNIPHSLGIPAVALSNCNWGGIHTTEEWIEKNSLEKGLKITMELILDEGGLL